MDLSAEFKEKIQKEIMNHSIVSTCVDGGYKFVLNIDAYGLTRIVEELADNMVQKVRGIFQRQYNDTFAIEGGHVGDSKILDKELVITRSNILFYANQYGIKIDEVESD